MALFTPEELEELRQADAEIEADFWQTSEEIRESRERDRQANLDRMLPEKRRKAAYQRAYREANKEDIAAYQRAYYEANKEDIAAKQRKWQKDNRERRNAYMREYRRRKKLERQHPSEPSG